MLGWENSSSLAENRVLKASSRACEKTEIECSPPGITVCNKFLSPWGTYLWWDIITQFWLLSAVQAVSLHSPPSIYCSLSVVDKLHGARSVTLMKSSLFTQNRLFPCTVIFIFSRWLTCLAAFLTPLTLLSSRWTAAAATWKQPAHLHQKSSIREMWLKWQMQKWERTCLCVNMTLYIRGLQKTEAIIACLKTWQIF